MNAKPHASARLLVSAVSLALPLLAAVTAGAGAPPNVSCNVRFVMQEAALTGAIQFEVDYSGADGIIVGSDNLADCDSLENALFAANDSDIDKTLGLGVISLAGFNGPLTVATCLFESDLAPDPADFVVTELDSTDPDASGILSNTCGAPATGSSPPNARDALVVVKKAVGQVVNCQDCECDTDNGGTIVVSDSLRVLRSAVGQVVTLTCPVCVAPPTSSPASESVTVTVETDCTAICPATPDPLCATSTKGSFQLSNDELDDSRDSLKWKFTNGPLLAQADFGNPAVDTSYTLCVYDSTLGADSLETSLPIPPSAFWSSKEPKGFLYKDSTGAASGLTKATLKTGALGKSKISLQAKGAALPMPVPFSGSRLLNQDQRVVVQLRNTDTADCWSTQFDSSTLNTALKFKAKRP